MNRVLRTCIFAALYVLTFEGVQYFVASVALVVIRFFSADYVTTYFYFANFIGAVADGLCVILLMAVLRARGADIRREIGFHMVDWRSALACVASGIALVIFVNNILSILPIPEGWWADYADSVENLSAGPLWAQILFTCIAAPVCEEIVFRGLLYNTCRRGMPEAVAIIVGALGFGIVHGQFLWVSYAAVCGFFLIMTYNNTGSVFGSLLMHLGFNGFSQFAPSGWNPVGIGWLVASCVILVGSYVIMRPSKVLESKISEAEL